MGHVLVRDDQEKFGLVDAEGPQFSMGIHREGHVQVELERRGRRVFSMSPSDGIAAAAWLISELQPALLTPALIEALNATQVIVR